MSDLTITRAGAERVDDIEELCRALFEAVASAGPDVPGVPSLLIGTGAGNHEAIRFYSGLGYTHWANQFLGRIPDEPR